MGKVKRRPIPSMKAIWLMKLKLERSKDSNRFMPIFLVDSMISQDKSDKKNISKWGFKFANAEFLEATLATIESMPENSFDAIISKYVEMNIAHPFMEGNGRTTRIWLDLILKKRLKKCVDRSQISKSDYLSAMIESVKESSMIKKLIQGALTDKISDRDQFMKGIDYSYYYEEEN